LFKRFLVVWLRYKLGKKTDVAALPDIPRDYVARAVRVYEAEGIKGLSHQRHARKRSALYGFEEVPDTSFEQEPGHSLAEAKDRIARLTGLVRGLTQVRAFLVRPGFRSRMTGHIPAKANPERQAKFRGETLDPLIQKAQNQEVVLLFMDAAHFVL